ncbi:MAG TPA: sigma-70 family RNA polymerase sigma factor, partial [Gemmatimonadales bacterium]
MEVSWAGIDWGVDPITSARFFARSIALARPMSSSHPAMSVVTDRELVLAASRGDERAIATLYDRHAGPLYAVAYRVTGERADAEEVVLEAFTQAWRDASRFDASRGSVAAWLTMMARSRALDLVRGRSRRGRAEETARQADPDLAPAMGRWGGGGETDPSGEVDVGERARRVREALAALSEPQREAVELAYYQGLSHTEIAARLNQPLGTVKTRV